MPSKGAVKKAAVKKAAANKAVANKAAVKKAGATTTAPRTAARATSAKPRKAAVKAKPSARAASAPGRGQQPAAAPKLPVVAVKPKRPTRPSLPLPPPPPPPPAQRSELIAPRDIGRLLRYGEPFGPHKIDVRMLPLQLPSDSTALAVCDPTAPKTFRVFDRPVAAGQFRVMMSVARSDRQERLAAIVVHVGRPPIAKWTVAHFRGQKPPKSSDPLPRVTTSGWLVLLDAGRAAPAKLELEAPTGISPVELTMPDGRRGLALPCGAGAYAAYWAIDAADKPVCLVVDFDVFTQKEWKAKPR